MSKIKDYYMRLFEKNFWEMPWLDMAIDFQELEKETFEVIKGNVKTTITYRFNKQGYPVSHTHQSEILLSEEDNINLEIENAVKQKDYERAAGLQKKLKEITNKTNKGEQ